jgi:hypothetical protein
MRKLFLKCGFFIVLTFLLNFSSKCTFISTNSIQTAMAAIIKINKTNKTMYIGDTFKLRIIGTNKPVKWSSGKKSVASVNKKGKVTAKKAGKATITAKAGGKKYICKIVVKEIFFVSKRSITCADKSSVTVTFNGSGTVYYKNKNKNVLDCEWGKWKDNQCELNIIPKQSGTAKIFLRNNVNGEKITITVKSTVDTSYKVKKISNQSVSYIKKEKCQRIFFSFEDEKNKNIISSASADIKIVNDNGDMVYNKIREITVDDFKYWKSDRYGTVLLCTIDIPDSEITHGSSKTGKLYYSVSHDSTFFYGEYNFIVTGLPCIGN